MTKRSDSAHGRHRSNKRSAGRTAPTGSRIFAFLFTDIEGSSQRWLDYRASMEAAVAQHDLIMRDAISLSGGVVFKTAGDAFFATFDEPLSAVRAAVAAQRELAQRDWSPVDGLKVRMAVHYGTAERRAGDYFGPALNRAARLLVLGHGGQILVTSTVAELLAAEGKLRESLLLLGSYHLDDPSQFVPIHQVIVPGLPQAFPPLRGGSPTNLPRQISALIGRDDEVEQVRALLAAGPLVTLTGIGGVGKTRLAMEIGRLLLDEFEHGVWRIELAPLADPVFVISAAATALGIDLGNAISPLDAFVKRLKGKRLLLILDNCEHVIGEVAKLAHAVLEAEPGIRVLATSQEALAIAGEQLFQVPPLAVPASGADPGASINAGAARLFVDRARAADPRFVLDERSSVTAATICRRLGGIPLAIEMAAARAPMLGLDRLERALDDRFRVLTAGRRTDLPRHATLRATLDWSHDLLAERDRVTLRRLCVFAGGFTLEEASNVSAFDARDEFEAAESVLSLAAKSLVSVDRNDERRMRYSLLETTRAYARAKLIEAGETTIAQRRHAAYFTGWFERAFYKDWWVGSQLERQIRYGPMIDNLRAALDWAFGSEGDAEAGVTLASASSKIWEALGLTIEGRQRIETAIARFGPDTPALIQARLWVSLEWMCEKSSPKRALAASDSVVDFFAAFSDTRERADALLARANTLIRCGRLAEGRAALEDAQSLADRAANERLLAYCDRLLGALAVVDGRLADARSHFKVSIERFRACKDDQNFNAGLTDLAYINWATGDLGDAIAAFRALIEEQRKIHFANSHLLAWTLGNLSGALTEQGNLDEALSTAREAMTTLTDEGSAWMFLDHLALRLGLAGHIGPAARLSGSAEAAYKRNEVTLDPMELKARERLRALLREKLPADELERGMIDGALLTDDQAMSLALGVSVGRDN